MQLLLHDMYVFRDQTFVGWELESVTFLGLEMTLQVHGLSICIVIRTSRQQIVRAVPKPFRQHFPHFHRHFHRSKPVQAGLIHLVSS